MQKPLACAIAAATLLLSATSHADNAPAFVDSKEYKVLLDPSKFASNPSSAASSLLRDLGVRLSQLAFDKTVSGSFATDKRDTVSYYDTAGTCVARNNGYAVRFRQGDDSDVEFKFSHADEELSAFTDVSGAGKNKSSKLETDISPGSLQYGHSTKQDPAKSGAPTSISDLIVQFPGASALSAFKSQALVPVNGLSITQQEYTGPSSDLGDSDAEFTLSLWYVGTSSTPALAELSFRVDADDDAYFTTPVLQRSQILLQAIGSLNGWTMSPSSGKTAWVYNYRSASYPSGFCSG